MRITGGKLGGRRLEAPADDRVRPTSDRTRQAIFNILAHKDFGIGFSLEGIAVADLFAGTGALGIEALSHGARFCLLVDDDAESRALIRVNVEALGLTGVTKIWRRDATDLGPLGGGGLPREVGTGSRQAIRPNKEVAGGPFGLVFLDPPYRKNLIPLALKSLKDGGWLTDNALLMAETSLGEDITAEGFEILDRRDYGETEIDFLTPHASTSSA
jgi:16S rRNA (guanine966-N2)-methyltransferase